MTCILRFPLICARADLQLRCLAIYTINTDAGLELESVELVRE